MEDDDDPLGWSGNTLADRVAVEALVGEGGFGFVYRGTHLGFEQPVAVKFLKIPAGLTEEQRRAFLLELRDEAGLLYKLSKKSTAIVQALDVGVAWSPRGAWAPYVVMEWLDGQSLERRLVRSLDAGVPLCSLAEAIALLTPAAEALAVSHAERVAHLDVKPANIFLCQDGSTKLLDFGIAKVLAASDTLTRAYAKVGAVPAFTPSYGAPEQFDRRHGPSGPWTDVFALALILVEVCSGQPALSGAAVLQLYVASVNTEQRPSLAARGVRVSVLVEDVVLRALAVDPQRRFPDVGAMWRALVAAHESSGTAKATVAPSIQPRSSADSISVSDELTPLPSARTALQLPSTTAAQNRVCTVLVAELGAADPAVGVVDSEALSNLVARTMSDLAACVEELGGAVERVFDDNLVAVFGMYGDSASAAERAVHAALRMGGALAQLSAPRRRTRSSALALRTGISTGRVHVGAKQSSRGLALTATGAPVKLAVRLQQAAPPAAVWIDRDTYRQVNGIFEVEPVDSAANGRPAEHTVYRIVAIARDRHGLHASAHRDFCGLPTRLVGRTAEMAALAAAADTAKSEPCARFVTVLGAPGIGRSRLLVELADRLETGGWAVLAAQASHFHLRTSYALAAALLRARFHIHDDDAPEVMAAKLERGVLALRGPSSGHRPEGELDLAEALAQASRLLGGTAIGNETAPNAAEHGPEAKQRIAGAIASLLLAAGRPVAILCDDLHAADEASLGLLEDLCVRLAAAPLFIACTARPDLLERRPLWGEGDPAHLRVHVPALERRQLEEMTRDRLRELAGLPAELLRRLSEHAEGSPLTLVETLHLLVDAGAIDASARDHWQLRTERLGELSLPTTVQGIVQARLDRLDEPARLLLSRAAVVGRTFWDGVLLQLEPDDSCGDGRTAPRGLLSQLRDRGLVHARSRSAFPDEQEYVFAEAATQRVAYEMLGRQERRSLHLSVARWLEARTASDAGAAFIAHHYERAAELKLAREAYCRAGAHAAALGQNAEARHGFERACKIEDWMSEDESGGESTQDLLADWEPPEDGRVARWPSRVEGRIALGDVLRRMGHFDAAEERYREGLKRIVPVERRLDDPIEPIEVPRWQARIDYRIALLRKRQGEVDDAIELLERAVERARAGRLAEELAEMWALLASMYERRRRLEDSRRACVEGLRVCRAIERRGDGWQQAVSMLLNGLGTMFLAMKKLVRAERCFLQAARAVDERRNPGQASHALNNVAIARCTRGDLARARDCFQRVLQLSERSGDLWTKMTVLSNLGEVDHLMGSHAGARARLTEAARLGDQIHAKLDLPEIYRNLARAHLASGDPAQALAAARRALELIREARESVWKCAVLETAAEICGAIASSAQADLHSPAQAFAREITLLIAEPGLPEDTAERCRKHLAATSQ